jgi:hypothetical protein
LLAVLATVFFWGLIYGIGLGHEAVETLNNQARDEFAKIDKATGKAGTNPEEAKKMQPIPQWVEDALLGARRALPRTYDVDKLAGRMIAKGVYSEEEFKARKKDEPLPSGWPEVIIISLFYIFVLLGLSCWRQVTRDG